MITKVYSIDNIVSARFTFYLNQGKVYVNVEFNGGIVDGHNKRPATYSTSDPIVMCAIENDERFDKLIKCTAVYGKADKKNTTVQSKPAAESNDNVALKENTAVSDYGQAREVLMEMGAKASELLSNASVIATARKYGIAFPNLKKPKKD